MRLPGALRLSFAGGFDVGQILRCLPLCAFLLRVDLMWDRFSAAAALCAFFFAGGFDVGFEGFIRLI